MDRCTDFLSIIKRNDWLGAFWSLMKQMLFYIIPRSFYAKDVSSDTVLITGAGSGLGRAMAVEFAMQGASLVLWDINKDGLEETKCLVEGCHKRKDKNSEDDQEPICLTFTVDVSNYDSVVKASIKVQQDLDKTADKKYISILVNNAGIFSCKSLLETEHTTIEKMFQINILAHFWTVKAFLPEMIQRKKGHIVEIASLSGLAGMANHVPYASTKHATVGLESSLSVELWHNGLSNQIKTTCVCPIYFNSSLFQGYNSSTVPLMTSEYVAREAVMAVRCEHNLVTIPSYWTILPMFRFILQREFINYCTCRTFGFGDSIRNMKGCEDKN